MYALGTHLLVELKECNAKILSNLKEVQDVLITAAKIANATIVETAFHEFSPFGISGMVVIAESHLSIHTWPEHEYAAVDIFTCGDVLRPEKAVKYLIEKFQCKSPSVVEVKRGILSPLNRKLPHKVSEEEFKSQEPAAGQQDETPRQPAFSN
ncbi:MAG TPA: adenosylmethionine decarboxylase [Nitrospirae bacterium]|nr:S-adenosylmethionine decarboxylase proenzyme precursor [bacterium BMS3Abin10]GBE38379.1 S-adenosylmethionine decarboxylase proenzyme precursor [bacterium BMS3Bbin08]HDH00864.1 adenosylmethionine decarboxylase [Nitrospirota bacterium]HDH51114.1 adenosylmethionine decarboxylase [Nitrospirota bacterium]HDK41293.1 adenosylmethionine decarboxylase [Nitrospirota bacterium]